jgi:hypothetical protein
MKTLWSSFPLLFLTATLFAAEKPAPPPPPTAEIVFRELNYDGKVSEDEARFTVEIAAEAIGKGEAQAVLFDGEIALLPPKLPDQLRIERDGNVYRLFVPRPGKYQLKLEVVAKITRTEPWNHVTFQGPSAAIARVTAQAPGADVDLQLLTGTMLESGQTNGASRVQGFLGAESRARSALAESRRRNHAQSSRGRRNHRHGANHTHGHQILHPISLRCHSGQIAEAHD